jgi:hypothetical protein
LAAPSGGIQGPPGGYDSSCESPPCWNTNGSAGNHGAPGVGAPNIDLEEWTARGWNGRVYVPNEDDPNCWDPTKVLTLCPNTRLETYGGNRAQNVSLGMDRYVAANAEADCGGITNLGRCATAAVFLWRFGEEAIITDPTSPNFNKDGDGVPWTGGANFNHGQRVVVARVRNFRFFEDTIESNAVQGFYVSMYCDPTVCPPPTCPPTCGPSLIANTVILTE